jgi:hypothetical protein
MIELRNKQTIVSRMAYNTLAVIISYQHQDNLNLLVDWTSFLVETYNNYSSRIKDVKSRMVKLIKALKVKLGNGFLFKYTGEPSLSKFRLLLEAMLIDIDKEMNCQYSSSSNYSSNETKDLSDEDDFVEIQCE